MTDPALTHILAGFLPTDRYLPAVAFVSYLIPEDRQMYHHSAGPSFSYRGLTPHQSHAMPGVPIASTGAGGRGGFKWQVVTAGPVMLTLFGKYEMYRMSIKPRLALSLLLPLIAGVVCFHVTAQDSPPLKHRDGLPTGDGSPEAAACDMVRALAHFDFQKFSKARPEGGGGGDTSNDIVNHYVSFVRDTTFQSDGNVVTAHDLLQRERLTLKIVASPVVIERELLRPYESWAFCGEHTQHSFVDVTVSGRDGTEFTTRMIVLCTRKHGLWKAYPIGLGIVVTDHGPGLVFS